MYFFRLDKPIPGHPNQVWLEGRTLDEPVYVSSFAEPSPSNLARWYITHKYLYESAKYGQLRSKLRLRGVKLSEIRVRWGKHVGKSFQDVSNLLLLPSRSSSSSSGGCTSCRLFHKTHTLLPNCPELVQNLVAGWRTDGVLKLKQRPFVVSTVQLYATRCNNPSCS